MHVWQVMLGVDRLDMIKGIPQKLLAFEKFLEDHPEWADRLQLVQIAVPSRVDVPEYQASLMQTCSPVACLRCRSCGSGPARFHVQWYEWI